MVTTRKPLVMPPVAPPAVEIPPAIPQVVHDLDALLERFSKRDSWVKNAMHYDGRSCLLGGIGDVLGLNRYGPNQPEVEQRAAALKDALVKVIRPRDINPTFTKEDRIMTYNDAEPRRREHILKAIRRARERALKQT